MINWMVRAMNAWDRYIVYVFVEIGVAAVTHWLLDRVRENGITAVFNIHKSGNILHIFILLVCVCFFTRATFALIRCQF